MSIETIFSMAVNRALTAKRQQARDWNTAQHGQLREGAEKTRKIRSMLLRGNGQVPELGAVK